MSDSLTLISEKQLAANRANARHSTGPRTPEGKARSARNARKHGFTASTFSIVRLEELDEVARLKDDLVHDYQPVNSQELFALERIALAQQALLRVARLEAGLLTFALDEALTSDDQQMIFLTEELTRDVEVTRQQNRNYVLAFGFHRMAQKANSWALFLRYQAQADRQCRRAIEEFERLKRLRPELPNEPILEPQPPDNEPPPPPGETNPSASGPLPAPAGPDRGDGANAANDLGTAAAHARKETNETVQLVNSPRDSPPGDDPFSDSMPTVEDCIALLNFGV